LSRNGGKDVQLSASGRAWKQEEENDVNWLSVYRGKIEWTLQSSQNAVWFVEARNAGMRDRHSGAQARRAEFLALSLLLAIGLIIEISR
jgi:hypothetical protein